MEVRFWAATDTGRKRGHNEDNFLVDRSLGLFVVCDGMGGHAAGEVASAAAIQTIRSIVAEGGPSIQQGSGLHRRPDDESAILELLERAVQEASRRVWQMGQDDEDRRGMGTTCSLIMFVGQRGFVAHVGDSRIYRMREAGVTQLTDDHSLRNHLIQEGQLDADEEMDRENAVTRAVGAAETIEVDSFAIDLTPGDRFVLCSDGLTEYLDDPDVLLEVAGAKDLEAATDACIAHANTSGGKDNVTALLVEVAEGQGVWDARRATPAGRALRVLPHFEHLTLEEFGAVTEGVDVREVDAETRLIESGQPPEGLMVVIDGNVELVRDGKVVDVVGPGDFFGERALLGDAQGGLVAETGADSTIAVFARSDFEAILAESEQLAAKISWNFAVRLMGKLQHLDEVEFRNPQLASMAQSTSGERLDDTGDYPSEDRASTQSSQASSSPPEMPPEAVEEDGSSPTDGRTEDVAISSVSDEVETAEWDPNEETLRSEDDPNDDTLVPGESSDEPSSEVETDRERRGSGAQVLERQSRGSEESEVRSGETEVDEGNDEVEEDVRETVQMEDFDRGVDES
ncbi:MAG: protein phosphatase 2C domain-containing protein [Bradymonadaceae bacterium]